MSFDWYAAIKETSQGRICYTYSVKAGQTLEDLQDKRIIASRQNITRAELVLLQQEVVIPQGPIEDIIEQTQSQVRGVQLLDYMIANFSI